jgi:hypothetical protein
VARKGSFPLALVSSSPTSTSTTCACCHSRPSTISSPPSPSTPATTAGIAKEYFEAQQAIDRAMTEALWRSNEVDVYTFALQTTARSICGSMAWPAGILNAARPYASKQPRQRAVPHRRPRAKLVTAEMARSFIGLSDPLITHRPGRARSSRSRLSSSRERGLGAWSVVHMPGFTAPSACSRRSAPLSCGTAGATRARSCPAVPAVKSAQCPPGHMVSGGYCMPLFRVVPPAVPKVQHCPNRLTQRHQRSCLELRQR